MIALSGQFLDIMVIIMLAVVGGLVLWLHYKLYTLKNSEKSVPGLVSSLDESIKKAHRGVFEFSRLIREDGPRLEKEFHKAQETVQDLDYMIDKAEKVLKRMDEAFERADMVSSPVLAAVKVEEKEVLFGKTANESSARAVESKPKTVKPKTEMPPVSETTKRLENEMQKTLERELLMGMNHQEPAAVEKTVVNEKPKRMASPLGGAMAYGQQSNVTSDAERDLRQALEGRL